MFVYTNALAYRLFQRYPTLPDDR